MLMLSMGMNAQNVNRDADTIRNESPKMLTDQHNPLVDYMYIADPTAIEHQGRLYVYGTNDTQQIDSVGKLGRNTYQYIKSLAIISTEDMVNWTYHELYHPHYRIVELGIFEQVILPQIQKCKITTEI